MSGGKNTFTIKFDEAPAKRLFAALVQASEEAVRPSAQAGAQVLYDEVKRNVGKLGKKTGNLAAAIYQVYSKDHSDNARAEYHVSWNLRKAPHGHLLEYGYVQRYARYMDANGNWHTNKKKPLPQPRHVAAHPFIRPAAAKYPEAWAAIEAEYLRRIAQGPLGARS